ncbi:MAG TPA: hypothetical protein VN667_12175 [Burkholderiales bacterium]|nr:hypothetical protein [Burkholderiales bacterium]
MNTGVAKTSRASSTASRAAACLLAFAALFGAAGPAMADASCGADTIGLDTQSWPFLEAALEQSAAAHAGQDGPNCAPPATVTKLRIEAADRASSQVAKISKQVNLCDARISETRCGRNELLERVVPVSEAGPQAPDRDLRRVQFQR